MSCGISLGGAECDGYNEFCTERPIKKARKAHRCVECRCTIEVGQPYVQESGKFDGDFFSHAYCQACFEIRKEFTEGGYTIGELWQEMHEYGFDNFTTGCLEGLSIPAKQKLLAEWRKWKGLV